MVESATFATVSSVSDKNEVDIGERFTVTVRVDNGLGFESGASWIEFDPSLVRLLSTENGDARAATVFSQEDDEIALANSCGHIANSIAFPRPSRTNTFTVYSATFVALRRGTAFFGFVERELFNLNIGSIAEVMIDGGTRYKHPKVSAVIDKNEVNIGDRFNVSVRVDDGSDLESGSAPLSFDRSLVRLLGTGDGDIDDAIYTPHDDNEILEANARGQIRNVFDFVASSTTGSFTLYTATFEAIRSGNAEFGFVDSDLVNLSTDNNARVAICGAQYEKPTVSAVSNKAELKVGEEFTVSIVVDSAAGLECGAAWLTFDPSAVELLGTDSGNTKASVVFSNTEREIAGSNVDGKIHNAFAYTSSETTDSVTIYKAVFKAIAPGKTEFGFDSEKLFELEQGDNEFVQISETTLPTVSSVCDKTEVYDGEQFTITVRVDNNDFGYESGAAWLSFDPNLVKLLYTSVGDSNTIVYASHNDEEITLANMEGQIRNAFAYLPCTSSDTSTVYTATFEQLASGTAYFGFLNNKLLNLEVGSVAEVTLKYHPVVSSVSNVSEVNIGDKFSVTVRVDKGFGFKSGSVWLKFNPSCVKLLSTNIGETQANVIVTNNKTEIDAANDEGVARCALSYVDSSTTDTFIIFTALFEAINPGEVLFGFVENETLNFKVGCIAEVTVSDPHSGDPIVSAVSDKSEIIIGDQFAVTVRIDNGLGFQSIRAWLAFDPTLVRLLRTEPGEMDYVSSHDDDGISAANVAGRIDSFAYTVCSTNDSFVVYIATFEAIEAGIAEFDFIDDKLEGIIEGPNASVIILSASDNPISEPSSVVSEPTTDPTTDPVTEPTSEPATEPVTESTSVPTTEPTTVPVTEHDETNPNLQSGICGPGLIWTLDSDGVLKISGEGEMSDYSQYGATVSPFAYKNNIKKVVIEEGVTSIGESAFCGCVKLENVTIPKSLIWIHENAFDRCGGLVDVFYSGSEEQWNRIVIDKNNTCLTESTILCSESSTSSPTTVPTTQPTTLPTTQPATQPVVPTTTEPASAAPTSAPTAASTTQAPTQAPPAEPVTVPPTVAPTTVPTTAVPTTTTPTTKEPATITVPEKTTLPEKIFLLGVDGISSTETPEVVKYASKAALTKSELVAAMTAGIDGAVVTVKDKDGNELADDAAPGTGSTVTVKVGEATVTKTLIVLGDVDGDGVVNASDARLALRAAAKLDTLEGPYASAADTDGDSTINATDARGILRAAAKLDVLKVD